MCIFLFCVYTCTWVCVCTSLKFSYAVPLNQYISCECSMHNVKVNFKTLMLSHVLMTTLNCNINLLGFLSQYSGKL